MTRVLCLQFIHAAAKKFEGRQGLQVRRFNLVANNYS